MASHQRSTPTPYAYAQPGPPPGPNPYGPPPGPNPYGPPPGPNPYGPPPPPPYGAPPPGPYGGPPGPPPIGRRRSKGAVIAIVVAALVVVAGGAVVAVLLLGGGDDKDGGGGAAGNEATGSAQATVAALVDAWKDKDCAAYDALLTERFRGAEEPCSPDQLDGWPTDSETNPEVVEETADAATAELDISQMDFQATYEITLVNEDGAWLIDAIETKVAFSGPSS